MRFDIPAVLGSFVLGSLSSDVSILRVKRRVAALYLAPFEFQLFCLDTFAVSVPAYITA